MRPFQACLLLLAFTAPSGALGAPGGDYSNLCRSPSGDRVGMTLNLAGSATAPAVRLQVCEGLCWNARITEVRLADGQLTFVAEERMLNDHNEISKQMFYRFTARLADDGAVLSANMLYSPQTLRRLGVPREGAAPPCPA